MGSKQKEHPKKGRTDSVFSGSISKIYEAYLVPQASDKRPRGTIEKGDLDVSRRE